MAGREPTKEERLAELLNKPPERDTEVPRERSRKESRDLGEAVGHRKCASIDCHQFGIEHPILVRGTEVVQYVVNGKLEITDTVENSWKSWEPVDPDDSTCPGCGKAWGTLPPNSRSVLDGVTNSVYGVKNDRDAVRVVYKLKGMDPPAWAKVERANAEVQEQVVKDGL